MAGLLAALCFGRVRQGHDLGQRAGHLARSSRRVFSGTEENQAIIPRVERSQAFRLKLHIVGHTAIGRGEAESASSAAMTPF